jgi:hypothetical protein
MIPGTFQTRVLEFETLTKPMLIREKYRDVTRENVLFLHRNLHLDNADHPNYQKVMKLLNKWHDQIAKGAKFLT